MQAATVPIEQPNSSLRSSCDGCTNSKVRCSGGHPCERCARRKTDCVYTEKRRSGPKRLRTGNGGGGGEEHMERSSVGPVTPKEHEYLQVFNKVVNLCIPLANPTTLRDAMNPMPLSALGSDSVTENDQQLFAARRALLLGCIALGALFSDEDAAADEYAAQARKHLKECYDALIPEVVSVYLLLMLYYFHTLEVPKVRRYHGFAQQAFLELPSEQRAANRDIAAVIRLMTVQLHVVVDDTIPVPAIDLTSSAPVISDPRYRLLDIISWVLINQYRRLIRRPTAGAQGPLASPDEMVGWLEEGERLLATMERPSDMALVIIKTLRGFFVLQAAPLSGPGRAAIAVNVLDGVARPVAAATRRTPGLLHFPLAFHMVRCVEAFLRNFGYTDEASLLNQHMSPLYGSAPFASVSCRTSAAVFRGFCANFTSFSGTEAAVAEAAAMDVDDAGPHDGSGRGSGSSGSGSGSSSSGSSSSGSISSGVEAGALVVRGPLAYQASFAPDATVECPEQGDISASLDVDEGSLNAMLLTM